VKRIQRVRLSAALFAVGLSAGIAIGDESGVELLGETVVSRTLSGTSVPVGGLSGLSYDATTDRFFAISDDPSRLGAARMYRLRIDLDLERPALEGVEVEATIQLRQQDGSAFALRTIDPESLARSAEGTWIVASEGFVDNGVPAALFEFTLDGGWVRRLRLPRRLKPKQGKGVRHNLALESATVTPEGRWFYTATENALHQDGGEATVTRGSSSRLLRYELPRGRRDRSYLYLTEPIALPPEGEAFAVNGLVDLLALDRDRLLALERSFTAGKGNTVRLFIADLGSSTDVSGVRRLEARSEIVAVKKRLLVDLADLGVRPDNIEGMAFGPSLPDGRRTLVLVADDNFNPRVQRNQLIALAVDPSRLADRESDSP